MELCDLVEGPSVDILRGLRNLVLRPLKEATETKIVHEKTQTRAPVIGARVKSFDIGPYITSTEAAALHSAPALHSNGRRFPCTLARVRKGNSMLSVFNVAAMCIQNWQETVP